MLNKITILNLSFLITHQVDAAFWHEWEMFNIPGGIQVFDIFNLLIFVLLLGCFSSLVARRPSGYTASFTIIAISGVVFPIHAGFALAGFSEFNLPVSIFAIVGTFIFSIWQAALTINAKHEFSAA